MLMCVQIHLHLCVCARGDHHARLLPCCQGFEHRSLCWHSRHFTDGDSSPCPQVRIFILSYANQVNEGVKGRKSTWSETAHTPHLSLLPVVLKVECRDCWVNLEPPASRAYTVKRCGCRQLLIHPLSIPSPSTHLASLTLAKQSSVLVSKKVKYVLALMSRREGEEING